MEGIEYQRKEALDTFGETTIPDLSGKPDIPVSNPNQNTSGPSSAGQKTQQKHDTPPHPPPNPPEGQRTQEDALREVLSSLHKDEVENRRGHLDLRVSHSQIWQIIGEADVDSLRRSIWNIFQLWLESISPLPLIWGPFGDPIRHYNPGSTSVRCICICGRGFIRSDVPQYLAIKLANSSLRECEDLKNTTDDAVAAYLKTKSFNQSHTLTDVRLALSTAACILAGGTFYLDYTQGFEKTKTFTLYACVAYFTINTALTAWMYLFEGSTIYVGSHKTQPVSLTITSKVNKHDPTYHLNIIQSQTLDGRKVVRVREVKNAFMDWIDEKGFFVKKPFETWLGASVPWILENEDVPKELSSGVVTASGAQVSELLPGTEVGSGKGSVRRKSKKSS
ncbi:hypothetical protein H072_7709 [Dactylellina haptotyla CBS 200.50]|uniref:Signal peptidase complex subunit 2 n=1 Tax=Dactylellina haptotyla (strain CBS 200.50) TaxID=1284197 RepID=S8ABV1_DACHA|nr:hypothetical protein H072_7709 [Dactylellina haptotyla CBS 200.50]